MHYLDNVVRVQSFNEFLETARFQKPGRYLRTWYVVLPAGAKPNKMLNLIFGSKHEQLPM